MQPPPHASTLTDDALGRWLAEETLRLCAIPSVTGAEGPIADDIEARCAALPGVRVRRMGNAIIADGPGRPRPPRRARIVLCGHSDTVRPAARQRLEISDGRVYGCGASDMKGGLALMLALLAEANTLAVDLRCIFYDREEGPANESGILPLCASDQHFFGRTRVALCLEPTDNRVEGGCLGGIHAQVVIPGTRAHSARPWQGKNAIYRALPLLSRLAAFPRREHVVDGLTFYEVLTVTQVSTDNSRNVVPDRVTLNVNYRYPPNRDPVRAEVALESYLAEAALETLDEADDPQDLPNPDDPLRGVRVTVVDHAPPGWVRVHRPHLASWIARRGLTVAAKQAWTDVARLTALGLTAANFGPGETAQAHQADESIPIANLVTGYRALHDLLTILPPTPQ